MPRNISHRLTLLAGACALSLAFAPNAFAAGGGGGGMGGSHFGGGLTTSSSGAHPMVAPMDHKTGPGAQDDKSHAPFHSLNGPVSTPQPATTSDSSHAPQSVTNASRPQPITGTRIPPQVSQQQIQTDPPPQGHGSVN
jgi:hypothetical protein